jgi:CBS domain-containing protein
MYQARDVMKTEVITINVSATVKDAIEHLLDHDISGMPVVDDQQRLVGIITEFRLLETIYTPEVRHTPLRDVMTTELVTVTETKLLSDVTNLMLHHRIRRIPVVRDGRLVGIISRSDMLRYILAHEDALDAVLEEVHAFVEGRL